MDRRGRIQFVILVLTNSLLQKTVTSNDNFSGHRLFRVLPLNEEHVEILQKLHYQPPANLERLDFWNEPLEPGESVYVVVPPNQKIDLEEFLGRHRIAYEVVIRDLQRVLDEHARKNHESRLSEEVSVYDTYLTFDEAMSWLQRMKDYCQSRCSLHNIGRSFEGRNMTLIKVSSVNTNPMNRKPSVWIDSGIHAREWIAPATSLYFIDRLIVDYDINSEVRYLVDNYDWYILPFVNPDGYQYSHDKNRLWRKTRSRDPSASPDACVGVDANRNFDFQWKSIGFQDDPCSDIFPGRKPFSEPETKALSDFVMSKNGTWKLFLTLHSYGQLLMAPYGYTTHKPDGYEQMMIVAAAAKAAIADLYGTDYTIGSASNVLYRSSGTSRDWAAGFAKIPFVYTIELRDRGDDGFLLPPDQILPSGIETWEGVKALVLEIDKFERFEPLGN